MDRIYIYYHRRSVQRGHTRHERQRREASQTHTFTLTHSLTAATASPTRGEGGLQPREDQTVHPNQSRTRSALPSSHPQYIINHREAMRIPQDPPASHFQVLVYCRARSRSLSVDLDGALCIFLHIHPARIARMPVTSPGSQHAPFLAENPHSRS